MVLSQKQMCVCQHWRVAPLPFAWYILWSVAASPPTWVDSELHWVFPSQAARRAKKGEGGGGGGGDDRAKLAHGLHRGSYD